MLSNTIPQWGHLQAVACNCCGRSDAPAIYTRPDGLTVVRCQGCGLAYVNPRPSPEEIQRLYSGDYFAAGDKARPGYIDYLSPDHLRDLRTDLAARLAAIEQVQSLAGLSCLDVGCATGELCGILRELGADPMGYDLDAEVIATARRRHGGIEFTTTYPEGRQFDAAFAIEVIEHTTSPKAFMTQLASSVKPGGLVALSTIHLGCGLHVGFDRWLGFHRSYEHLYYFTHDVLQRYGRASGLELVQWFTGGVAGTFRPPPMQALWKRLVRSAANATGIWPLMQRMRRRVASPFLAYEPGGTANTILGVFRKPFPA